MYNMASSLIKSGKLDEGLELLSKLIELDGSYREQAKCDVDFTDIKHLNKFKEATVWFFYLNSDWIVSNVSVQIVIWFPGNSSIPDSSTLQ